MLAGAPPVQTHISAVFLGADTVWKLRKSVRLSFLDFTDLAERRRTALREFDLNSAAAPGLYRDVVPVVRRADGTLALGGAGEAVDWVVRMARVPAEDFLENRLPDGLDPAMLAALGDSVAAWHAALAPADKDQAAAMPRVAEGNVQAALDAGLPEARVQPVADRGAGRAGRKGSLAARPHRARLCSPRPWRPASGQYLPLAGQAGAVRCAGVRRGPRHHRPRL